MNREAKGCLEITRKPRALGLQATTRHNGVAVSIDDISKGVAIGAGSIRTGMEGKNRENKYNGTHVLARVFAAQIASQGNGRQSQKSCQCNGSSGLEGHDCEIEFEDGLKGLIVDS